MNITKYTNKELVELAKKVRKEILESVSINGGHLSSNLASVESTIALFKVFNFPTDSLLFDVGHQCYTYKILTDRNLINLRKDNGTSGFQNIEESVYDYYDAGHSSTSIGIASGRAMSFYLNKEERESICYIGDGSLANGLALEAINHLATLPCKVIIIINDNNMSISNTVGGLENLLKKDKLTRLLGGTRFKYIDNVDGHDFTSLINAYKEAKETKKSVIIHINTIKGKGYELAEKDNLGYYHKVPRFDLEKGITNIDHSNEFIGLTTRLIEEKMEQDEKIVVVVPANSVSSSLEHIKERFPGRFFDVGMAEEHALLFAQGLATNNIHPYVFIHSTFLQRGYDELLHDLARNKFNVTVIIDKIGINKGDGKTHQGIYDLGYLYSIPNIKVATPSSSYELIELLEVSNKEQLFIRIPNEKIVDKKYFYIHNPMNDTVIISYGPVIHKLKETYGESYDILNMIYQKPLDTSLIRRFIYRYKKVVIVDPYGSKEGFSKEVRSLFTELHYEGQIYSLSLDDKFYDVRSDSRVSSIEISRVKKLLENE